MSNFVTPGHYKLLTAVITTEAGITVDMVSLIPVFSIEESIDNDSLRGTALVYDNIGVLEDLPIRGEETLELTIEDALGKQLSYTMSIYKITDVEMKTNNDGLRYKIHLVSKSRFEAGSRRIIAPYEDTISNIVEDVFSRYYPKVSKDLLLEDTEGLFRCVIPNYTPMQTMNFLSSRAYSSKSPSCSFRFFETSENYYFVSDEYLIKRFLENPQDIKEFTYGSAVDKSSVNFLEQMKNVITLRNSERVNTVMDLVSGAYKSNVIEIDLIKRQVTLPGKSNKFEYDYDDAKTKYMSSSGKGETEEVHTNEFVERYFTRENERRYIVVRDYDDTGTAQLRGDQFIPEIITNRTAYLHHLNNTVTNITINGRLDVNAGDVINLKLLAFNSAQDGTLNKQLAGNYLVNNLMHSFDKDIHKTTLKLVKYDWSTKE